VFSLEREWRSPDTLGFRIVDFVEICAGQPNGMAELYFTTGAFSYLQNPVLLSSGPFSADAQ
jgi:hypothetical protein